MRFRPSPFVTVLLAACVITQLSLSRWQYGRHVDQLARKADVASRMRAPPAGNADLTGPADGLIWRKAALTGVFEPTQTYVTGRFEFGQPGFDVIGVLAVDAGPRLLVNRGWIPLDGWSTHLSAVPPGPARVEGLLLPADDSMVGTGCASPGHTVLPAISAGPDGPGAPERWPGPVWPAIAASLAGSGELLPVVLYVGPELERPTDKVRDPLPAVGWIARPKHIGHLEYAGQWLLIAMVFTGGWVYTGVVRGRQA